MPERPPVPEEWLARLDQILAAFPDCHLEDAWVGTRWQVRGNTICHVFGGEDQLYRITFRADLDEVIAFEHLGAPYFRVSWGSNVVGLIVDDDTDWDELRELLTDSYCIQAPVRLAEQVSRPERPAG